MRMPDLEGFYDVNDWLDEVNTLTDEDPANDDDESAGTCDEMGDWDLDGDEEDEEE